MRVNHLYHSGVLLETVDSQIFMDCVSHIDDLINSQKSCYFFVSHNHKDHFNPSIFKWKGEGVYYILSEDIDVRPFENGLFVAENNHYEIGSLSVDTYGSTDQGVSFMVKVADKLVFHAGDLNWWHWENDSKQAQVNEALAYKTIVDGIPCVTIDLACIPLDPRLGTGYSYGADYFLEQKNVLNLLPIHFDTHYEVCEQYILKRNMDPRILQVKSGGHSTEI